MRNQLFGNRQEHQVGEPDTVDGGNKSHRNTGPELGGVGQVLHDVDQPHHRPENADGRRVAARGFPDLGRLTHLRFPHANLDLQHFTQPDRLHAVDQQLQPPAHERIAQGVDLVLQHEQTFLARNVAPVRHLIDHLCMADAWRHEHPARHAHPVDKDTQRTLQHDRPQRTADHDEKGGRLDQRGDMSALEHLAANNGCKPEREAENADAIHVRNIR